MQKCPSSLLRSLQFGSLVEYLKLTGWERVESPNRWLVFKGYRDIDGNPLEIVLPSDPRTSDIGCYVASVVDVLSAVKGLPPELVVEDVLKMRKQGNNSSHHIADVEDQTIFHPYPNPEVEVEILQSIGNLRLARSLGLRIILWKHPRNAEPDPERPGMQRWLSADSPIDVLSFGVSQRIPRQRRSTVVFCTAFGDLARWTSFYLAPKDVAALLDGFGFDPTPLLIDVRRAGWEIVGLVDPEDMFAPGTPVTSRDGEKTGYLTGSRRPCQMESCPGERLGVRWPDAQADKSRSKVTFPCTQGMEFTNKGGWRIL